MAPSERSELAQEVATVVAHAMAQTNERIFGRMFELQEHMTGLLEHMTGLQERMTGLQEHMIGLQQQMIGLEKQQLQLLEHISERQDGLMGHQIKATEALALILAKLRSN